MTYSIELAENYSKSSETFDETDKDLFQSLEKIGVKGKDILDFGCGDGRHSLLIKNMGANQVIGMDVSKRMIELAKEKTQDIENISFVVAEGTQIPLKDESVDLVSSNFVVHYFTNSTELFLEISRVMKSGGFFIGTFNITEVDAGFEHLHNTNMPIRLGQPENPVVVQNLIKPREEIYQALKNAGLTIQEEKELDHPTAVVDDSFVHKDQIHKLAVLIVAKK